MLTRRQILQGSVGALALGGGLPGFLKKTLAAQIAEGAPGHRRVLVVITLAGGNDGLNTVIPIAQDAYWKARPNIAPPKNDIRKLNDNIGIHPSMKKLEAAHKEGRLSIIQAVGYPNPNRSHFHSMDVWQTGDPELKITRTGWLGRALDHAPEAHNNTLYAFHVGEEVPRLLLADTQRVTIFSSLQDYTISADRYAQNDRGRIEQAWQQMVTQGDSEIEQSPNAGGLRLVRRTAAQALTSAKELKDVLTKSTTNATYPGGGLAQQLKLAGQVIGAELPVHVISLTFGGFDTHANQRPQHAQLWQQIDDALAAFHDDLVQRQRADDVITLVYSEFGRRVSENGSGGTDHGAAAPVLLFGSKIQGGIVGEHPSLSDLDDGDVKFTTDFRRIYSTVLDHWLSVDSAAVLGGKFETLPVLKSAV